MLFYIFYLFLHKESLPARLYHLFGRTLYYWVLGRCARVSVGSQQFEKHNKKFHTSLTTSGLRVTITVGADKC